MASLLLGRRTTHILPTIQPPVSCICCNAVGTGRRYLQNTTYNQKIPEFAFAFEYGCVSLLELPLTVPQHRWRTSPQPQSFARRSPNPLLPSRPTYPIHLAHKWRWKERGRTRCRAQRSLKRTAGCEHVGPEPYTVHGAGGWCRAV